MTPEQELEQIKASYMQCASDIAVLEEQKNQIAKKMDEAEAKIEAAKVTYSIGDRFEIEDREWLLSILSLNKVGLIEIASGARWSSPIDVEAINNITQAEIIKITGGYPFTRTYDSRKKEYTGEKITEFVLGNGVFMPVKVEVSVGGHCIRMEQKDGQIVMLDVDSTPELLSQLTKMLR